MDYHVLCTVDYPCGMLVVVLLYRTNNAGNTSKKDRSCGCAGFTVKDPKKKLMFSTMASPPFFAFSTHISLPPPPSPHPNSATR